MKLNGYIKESPELHSIWDSYETPTVYLTLNYAISFKHFICNKSFKKYVLGTYYEIKEHWVLQK